MSAVPRLTARGWTVRGLMFASMLALLVGVAFHMRSSSGRHAINRSDAAFDRGDVFDSLSWAEKAAGQYYPGASHVAAARERIHAIAVGAEAKGNEPLARRAWASLRGANLEVYHLGAFSDPEMEQVDAQAARLLVRALDPKKQRSFSERQLMVELREARPRQIVSLGAGAGFVLMVLATLLWGLRSPLYRAASLVDSASSPPRSGALVYPTAERLLWLTCLAAGALLWTWAALAR